MYHQFIFRVLVGMWVMLVVSACGVSVKPVVKPELPVKSEVERLPEVVATWWQSFNDATLNQLVSESLQYNYDVRLAAERLLQADAALRVARSTLYPALDVSAGVNRSQFSTVGAQPFPPDYPRANTNHQYGLMASYEVDLWGRLSAQRMAATANREALALSQEAARTLVIATVTRSYITLRTLDADYALLEQALRVRNEAVSLQELRLKAGVIDKYALALAESERAGVAAELPPVQVARAQTEIALAALLGRSPRQLFEQTVARGAGVDALAAVPDIPVGLPSDLLLRRPDVRAAEAQLIAANASVAESRARWFPSISLSAALGAESKDLSDLFSSAARTWNVGALLAQPLAGLTRLRAQTREQEALARQAEWHYLQTAQQAYADALSALVAHRGAAQTLQAVQTRLVSEANVRALAQQQFEAGQIDRVDVLDHERAYLGAQRALVQAQRTRALALVDVYSALGGGWNPNDKPGCAKVCID